ncbi:MAG: lamin tail domain-containing protein [Flavobacteriales bacterium]|nr:lamin tail domain-containing protein [Flavobacteriales bacterium]
MRSILRCSCTRICILLLLLLPFTLPASAQIFWTEDFETDGSGGLRYTLGNIDDEFNDGSSDHYGRTDGTGISGTYTGANGTFFWAGEDIDDNGGNLVNPKQIIFNSASIVGMTDVRISGLFGEADGQNDVADHLQLDYRIDGGPWTPAIWFAGINNGDATNNGAAEDLDFNGVGDGTVPTLTSTLTSYSFDIAVSGGTIELRLEMFAGTGSSTWGFDLLQLEDISGAAVCGVSLGAESAICFTNTPGPGNDTYDLSIPYSGIDAGTSVVNNSGSGIIAGDDPALVPNGIIEISGISEDDAYSVTFTSPCDALTVSGAAPVCEPPPTTNIVINEIRTDQVGADNDEYFELAGPALTSLNGLTYLVIGDGAAGSGVIESVSDLTGSTIPASGFFLAAEATFSGTATPDLITNLNFENADNTTHLLVSGFSGTLNDDLDTNDDGVLDVEPWTAVLSSVAILNTTSGGDLVYSTDQVGPDNGAAPGHVYRCSTVWFAGPFDISGGADSPGLDNPNCGCLVALLPETTICNATTYDLEIPYTGVQPGTAVLNFGSSGTVAGDDPAVVPNGTIIIENIDQADGYDIELDVPCDAITLSGPAPNCAPPADYLVLKLNEVDYDQPSTDNAEFIELINTGAVDLDLNGVQVEIINGAGVGSVATTITLPSVILPAGDFYVICTDAANVANCDLETTFSIQNGAPDGVALRSPAPASLLLDALSYEGDCPAPYTEGSGVGLEDPGNVDAIGLSRITDGVDTDQNNVDWAARCISPGASNLSTFEFCICEPPTVSVAPVCIDLATFQINVNVTDLGSSGTVNITSDLYGYFEFAVGIGTYIFGPYNNNDVVTITVAHDSFSQCDVVFSGITEDCTPPPPCFDNEMSLEIRTDEYPDEITWQISQSGGGPVVCADGPYFTQFATVLETCCLVDGCYDLTFFDSFGDGINAPFGRIVLRDPNGDRILDGDGSYFNTGQADFSFCVPIGDDELIFNDQDRLDWSPSEFIVASENPAVSAEWGVGDQTDDGYQFQFMDAEGGYARRIFRSHATSGGFGPPSATRACHLRISSMVTLPVPFDRLLNVRVRSRVNGSYSEFGPASRFLMPSTLPACPTTKLIDNPNQTNYSCDLNLQFGGSDKVYAYPVQGANRYQFSFRIFAEGFVRNIASTNPARILNWNTLPLEDGKNYDVLVRASFDNGSTWCDWGDSCKVFISVPPATLAQRNAIKPAQELRVYPNPTRNDQVWMDLTVPEAVSTLELDLFDISGRKLMGRVIAVSEGSMNLLVDLPQGIAPGVFSLVATMDGAPLVERLIVE